MARGLHRSIFLRMTEQPKSEDHLGRAAEVKHAAYAAERAGDLDAAWRLHHERRQHYLKHAYRQRFTKTQTLALDADVAEDLANILRKEGRHLDAFVEILYWVTAQRRSPIKRHATKLQAYFKRSGISSISIDDVTSFVSGANTVSYQSVRRAVATWSGKARA